MKPGLIASKQHTLTLFAIFFGVAVVTTLQMHKGGHQVGSKVPLYLGAIAFEWLLFYATWRGLKAKGTPLRELMGTGPLWQGLLLGVVAYPLIALVGTGVKWALAHAGLDVDQETARTVAKVGPKGLVETVLWIAVSLSAGICEEFVFRGYLMRQLAAWFGGWPQGLVLSAIVFGLGHAYEGLGPVLTIVVHGISFGLIALVTRRLLPGMTAHAAMDIVAGLSG
jgi:membrane protease YdiL (CAAX protease family)